MLEKTGLKSTGLVNMLEANKNSFLQFLFFQSKSYKLDQLAVQAGILWWYIVFFFSCVNMYTHKNECASMGMCVAWHVCEGQRTTTLGSQFLLFRGSLSLASVVAYSRQVGSPTSRSSSCFHLSPCY